MHENEDGPPNAHPGIVRICPCSAAALNRSASVAPAGVAKNEEV